MFDTLAIARRLADAGIEPAHADALTDAIRDAAEHHRAADLATRADLAAQGDRIDARITAQDDRFDARFAARDDRVDARIATLEARIYRAMLLQAGVIIGAIVGAIAAILRFTG